MDEAAGAQRQKTVAALDELIERVESGPPSTPVDVDAARFELLARLVAARTTIAPPARPRPPILPLLALGLVIGLLLLELSRRGETEIEAELVLSSFRFQPAKNVNLTPPPEPANVSIAGTARVVLPEPSGQTEIFERQLPLLLAVDASTAADRAGAAHARDTTTKPSTVAKPSALAKSGAAIEPDATDTPGPIDAPDGVLKPEAVTLTPKTEAALSFDADRKRIALQVDGGGAGFNAALFGPIHVEAGTRNELRNYVEQDTLRASSIKSLRVSASLPAALHCIVCDPVPVTKITFTHQDLARLVDIERADSALQSGTLQFAEVPSRYELRRGEPLRLTLDTAPDRISEIRAIWLDPESKTLRLSLHAWVTKLEAGSVSQPTNLMPSTLEYLRARRGPELIWGTLVALLAAFTAIKSWFKPERP